MNILAIDPGPEKSGVVMFGEGRVLWSCEQENEDLIRRLSELAGDEVRLVIEMVASYGMAVGKEVFDTCVWIGRFTQVAEESFGIFAVKHVFRKDIKMHLCHSMRAKDANIRQALIDKHGVVGTKKNPGPLFGISGHLWAALAVADYAADTMGIDGEGGKYCFPLANDIDETKTPQAEPF